MALSRLGRFNEADQSLQEAMQLCSGSACEVEYGVKTALGVVELDRSRPDRAEDFFRSSLQIARQHGDSYEEADALLNLGVATVRQEHYDEAIDWWSATRKVAQAIDSGLNEEKALGNLAWTYYRMGDFDRALAYYLDAEKRAQSLGIVVDQVRWFNNIGLVYYRTNKLTVAEDYYKQSLALAQKIGDSGQKIIVLTSLAFLSAQRKQFDVAEQYAKQVFELSHRQGDRATELYALFTMAQVAAGAKDARQAERLYLEVAQDKQSEAPLRWQVQNELARLYEQENRIAAADQQYDNALSTLECARDSLRNEEFKLPFLANASQIYDDYVRFLVDQGKTNEALQAANYSRAQTLSEGLGVLKKEKNCILRPKSFVSSTQTRRAVDGTVLFYWLGQQQSYLWVLNTQNTTLIKLPPAAEIDPIVQNYRKALLESRDVLESGNKDGSRLYEILVEPAQKFIPANSHVTIVADGSLNNLNFETLLVSKPKPHYWIEDVNLTNASSLRILAASNTALRRNGGKLLLIGDPIVPDPKFPSLPSAKIEMQNIEKHFAPGAMQVFSRSEANPAAFFKSNPESFSYLHFVAHGTASRLSPLDSAVILSKATAEEDSYKLHARDIIGHPLHADLAVISTCYGSGSTVYNGEGLVGLSWAFLRAGVHNVIGALWAVSDASTPQLMDQLYAELGKGRSPRDALRAAKLTLLHSQGPFRKPVYWAPFQLYTGS